MSDTPHYPSELPRTFATLDGISLLLAREVADHMDVREHAQRVEATSRLLAGHVGIEGRELELLSFAARWHDAGKLFIDNKYLRKTGKLDPHERAIVERHAADGAARLNAIPGIPREVAEVAAYHHERYDGHGYAGLVGEAIPFLARIVNIADVHDALRSARDYKPEFSEAVTLGIMTKDEPTPGFGRRAFDPILLRQFVAMRLADLEVDIDSEARVQFAEFAASDPMLDLPEHVRDSGQLEFDALHWRHFYTDTGAGRQLVTSQDTAGHARELTPELASALVLRRAGHRLADDPQPAVKLA